MSEFLDLHGRTSKVLRALADAAMRRHGLHVGQNHLLAVLWERDGSTPGEVAAALNVTTPTVRSGASGSMQTNISSRVAELRDPRSRTA